jgi:hypothetical protein
MWAKNDCNFDILSFGRPARQLLRVAHPAFFWRGVSFDFHSLPGADAVSLGRFSSPDLLQRGGGGCDS